MYGLNIIEADDWKQELTVKQPMWRQQMSRAYEQTRRMAARDKNLSGTVG